MSARYPRRYTTGSRVRSEMCDKFIGMLGLAMRAGKLTVGTEQVFVAMAKGRIKLVVASAMASEGTKKKIRTKCEYYGVRLISADIEIGELGRMLGKTYAPACVGVCDENFAKALTEIIGST